MSGALKHFFAQIGQLTMCMRLEMTWQPVTTMTVTS